MNWDDLKFLEQQQPERLKPRAHVTVWSRRGNHIAAVTEIDATAGHGAGLYSVELPFLNSDQVLKMLDAWKALMEKR